jgi:hypothetical protein
MSKFSPKHMRVLWMYIYPDLATQRTTLVTSFPVHLIHQVLPAPLPPYVLSQHLECSVGIHIRRPTDMRCDQDIWSSPQRIINRKGLRISHINCRAADQAIFQRFHKRRLINDLTARDIGNISASLIGLIQELELFGGEEVRSCFTVLVVSYEPLLAGREAYVNGTAMTSRSISCFRNSWTSSLLVPLYHALGKEPSGSPVPGTM